MDQIHTYYMEHFPFFFVLGALTSIHWPQPFRRSLFLCPSAHSHCSSSSSSSSIIKDGGKVEKRSDNIVITPPPTFFRMRADHGVLLIAILATPFSSIIKVNAQDTRIYTNTCGWHCWLFAHNEVNWIIRRKPRRRQAVAEYIPQKYFSH